jgi:eukaryotic-like serine/threonine-protein kinase
MGDVRPSIQGSSARYEPLFKLASGGMATVYVGRLVGALGFQRLVAIKRPHRHLLDDPRFVKMLLAEATLASKLQHPNVVSVQDVVLVDDVVYLVMDLVDGASLSELMHASTKRSQPIPPGVAIRMLLDTCAGLHAAHELSDDTGASLGLVHRDVSPHNVLVGVDGVARVADFGIAKCVNVKGATTTTGTLKGKYAYMAPEHINGRRVDRRADVFSLGVVAWELFAGRRLFSGESPANTMMKVVHEPAPPLSEVTNLFGTSLDDVLAQALTKEPDERFLTVEAFAAALEGTARSTCGVASSSQVCKLVRVLVGEGLDKRKARVKALLDERADSASDPERPTEPLPEHMAALDQAPSLPGSVVQPTQPLESAPPSMSVRVVRATAASEQPPEQAPEISRPPLLPDRENTSGVHGPTPMSAITANAETSPQRRSWAWVAILGALALGGAATLGVQQLIKGADSTVQTEAGSAASDLVGILDEAPPAATSALTPAATAPDARDSGADVMEEASAGAVAPTAPTRGSGRSSGESIRGGAPKGSGKSSSDEARKDSGPATPPAIATGGGSKTPPPNPYATE